MIEQTIINLLKNDSELSSILSVFNEAPAIFTDTAPQEAEKPYIVFDIQTIPVPTGLVIDMFNIDIDIYDKNSSSKSIRDIVERIIFITDLQVIETDPRYGSIRFYRGPAGYVDKSNIYIKHYNLQIEARGTRRKWIKQL